MNMSGNMIVNVSELATTYRGALVKSGIWSRAVVKLVI